MTNLDRPWMIALEMQLAALRNTDIIAAVDPDRRDRMTESFRFLAKSARPLLRTAQAFAWSADAASAVLFASRTIPSDTSFEQTLLPDGMQSCFWWFDQPFSGDTFHFQGPVHGLLCGLDDKEDLHLHAIGYLEHRGPLPLSFVRVPRRSTLKDMKHDADNHPETHVCHPYSKQTDRDVLQKWHLLVRFFLSACVWLQQRIAVTTDGHVERHLRKRWERENQTHGGPQTYIKIVQLRRTEAHEEVSESGTVDWSCRWVVNGHWRNQPYKHERKLIYILPYVKGPEDKPFKVPTHTVYEVSR